MPNDIITISKLSHLVRLHMILTEDHVVVQKAGSKTGLVYVLTEKTRMQ